VTVTHSLGASLRLLSNADLLNTPDLPVLSVKLEPHFLKTLGISP
jgi:hypothetical protein